MAGNSPDDLEMAADGRLVCNPDDDHDSLPKTESCSLHPEACELEYLLFNGDKKFWSNELIGGDTSKRLEKIEMQTKLYETLWFNKAHTQGSVTTRVVARTNLEAVAKDLRLSDKG